MLGDLHLRSIWGDLNVWGDLISVGGPETPVGTQLLTQIYRGKKRKNYSKAAFNDISVSGTRSSKL